ncbi:MAG: hypothetical protein AAFP99_04320 [Pseudomonadota bacterium]
MSELTAIERAMFLGLSEMHYRRIGGGTAMERVGQLRQRAFDARSVYDRKFGKCVVEDIDLRPETHVLGLFRDEELLATVRLNVIERGNTDSPACWMFGSVLGAMVDLGQRFIDPSRLAVLPDAAEAFPYLPILMLRQAVLATGHYTVDHCLSVIKPEHEGFYRRVFRSTRFAGPIQPADMQVNAVLLGSARSNGPAIFKRYPIMMFTRAEQEAIFADVPAGADVSEPVLASAAEAAGISETPVAANAVSAA